jgi:hypothetical protein
MHGPRSIKVAERFLSKKSSQQDALESIIPGIQESDHITMLKKKFTVLPAISQKDSMKPNGLWYSCGTEWIEWVLREMSDWVGSYVYRLHINYGNMLKIDDAAGIDEVTKKYVNERMAHIFPGHKSSIYIDWVKMAKDYSGIEICPYQHSKRLDPNSEWYYGWDVASGCVWNQSALAGVELIYEYDSASDVYRKVGQG